MKWFGISLFLLCLFGVSSAQPVTGTFDSSFGELRLIEKEGVILGDYAEYGVIVGKRTGNTIEATFVNRQSGKRVGKVTFAVSEKGRQLKGTWGWVGEKAESSWTATQKRSGAVRLKNFGGGSGAQNFSGEWNTNYGKIALVRVGSVHAGFYGEKGIVYGTVTGASLRGHFTNGAEFGEMSQSSMDGKQLKGRWRFEGKSWSADGDWTGTKIEASSGSAPPPTTKPLELAAKTAKADIEGTYRITFTRIFNGMAYNGFYGAMGVYLNGRILSGDVTIRPQDGKPNRVVDIPKSEMVDHRKLPRPVRHTNYINLSPQMKPEHVDFTHAYTVDRIREFKVLGEAANEHAVFDFQSNLGTEKMKMEVKNWRRVKLRVSEIELGKKYMVFTDGGWACFLIEKR